MAQGTTKGVPIDTDPLLAANSDLLVPSEKAVRTYIAANSVAFSSLFANPPLSYNGAGVFSITQASASTNGYLSSTDWSTFNAKVPTGSITTSGLTQNTNKLLGRGTAGVGAIEEITLGTNLSLSGTTLNASGGGITALTGDVTASGTGSVAATIANDAVSYDKMADEGKLAMIGMLRFISGN